MPAPCSDTGDEMAAKRDREFGSHECYDESEVGGSENPQQWLCNYRNTFSAGEEWGSLKIPNKKPALQRERRAA